MNWKNKTKKCFAAVRLEWKGNSANTWLDWWLKKNWFPSLKPSCSTPCCQSKERKTKEKLWCFVTCVSKFQINVLFKSHWSHCYIICMSSHVLWTLKVLFIVATCLHGEQYFPAWTFNMSSKIKFLPQE